MNTQLMTDEIAWSRMPIIPELAEALPETGLVQPLDVKQEQGPPRSELDEGNDSKRGAGVKQRRSDSEQFSICRASFGTN